MLKKKSPKGFLAKVWQSRFVVLYDDVMQYFKNKTDTNPAGEIYFFFASLSRASERERDREIQLLCVLLCDCCCDYD